MSARRRSATAGVGGRGIAAPYTVSDIERSFLAGSPRLHPSSIPVGSNRPRIPSRCRGRWSAGLADLNLGGLPLTAAVAALDGAGGSGPLCPAVVLAGPGQDVLLVAALERNARHGRSLAVELSVAVHLKYHSCAPCHASPY